MELIAEKVYALVQVIADALYSRSEVSFDTVEQRNRKAIMNNLTRYCVPCTGIMAAVTAVTIFGVTTANAWFHFPQYALRIGDLAKPSHRISFNQDVESALSLACLVEENYKDRFNSRVDVHESVLAQEFIPSIDYELTKVALHLTADRTATVTVRIQDGPNDGDKVVAEATSTILEGQSQWIIFDVPNVRLSSGQSYFIRPLLNNLSAVRWARFRDQGGGDPYPNGRGFIDGVASRSFDWMFVTKKKCGRGVRWKTCDAVVSTITPNPLFDSDVPISPDSMFVATVRTPVHVVVSNGLGKALVELLNASAVVAVGENEEGFSQLDIVDLRGTFDVFMWRGQRIGQAEITLQSGSGSIEWRTGQGTAQVTVQVKAEDRNVMTAVAFGSATLIDNRTIRLSLDATACDVRPN